MKKEKNILLITMILNFLIASIKLICGIIFNFSSLIADSLHSFLDFITDIISSIANKIGKKRANKKYPFGYGMIENISNLLIGIILFLLALYILITSFQVKETVLVPVIFIILITAIILKTIVIGILYHYGKKLNSNIITVSAKESTVDLTSSIIVLIISIILLFENKYPILIYADSIGSILISIIIFKTAITIMIDNISYLLGVNEENEEITNEINNILKEHNKIKDSNIKLMRIGAYYNLYLTLEFEPDISIKQVFNLEKRLKKQLRKEIKKIRFIEIEVEEYDEK